MGSRQISESTQLLFKYLLISNAIIRTTSMKILSLFPLFNSIMFELYLGLFCLAIFTFGRCKNCVFYFGLCKN